MEQKIVNERQARIEALKSELTSIKSRISTLRKQGIEVKAAEYRIGNIPSKIRIAEITEKEEDISKIGPMLKDAATELNEAEGKQKNKEFGLDYNKSYQDYSSSQIIIRTGEIIKDAHKSISEGDFRSAFNNYAELKDIYKYLPVEMKKQVYSMIIDIYKKIINSKYIIDKESEKKRQLEDIASKKRKGWLLGIFGIVKKRGT